MSIELLLIIPNMTYVIFFKKLTYYAYTVYNFEYKICSMGHTLILKACKPPKWSLKRELRQLIPSYIWWSWMEVEDRKGEDGKNIDGIMKWTSTTVLWEDHLKNSY